MFDHTRFDHALAIVGTMCAREAVADAMARGCTRDIKAAQEASSKATMRLLKVEARNG